MTKSQTTAGWGELVDAAFNEAALHRGDLAEVTLMAMRTLGYILEDVQCMGNDRCGHFRPSRLEGS